jgi:hypothetical protein
MMARLQALYAWLKARPAWVAAHPMEATLIIGALAIVVAGVVIGRIL